MLKARAMTSACVRKLHTIMGKASDPQRILDPVEPPIGIFKELVRSDQAVLVFKEKVWNVSTEIFDVFDSENAPVVRCSGKAFHLRNVKQISDLNGGLLFNIRNKVKPFLRHFWGEDETGMELFVANKKLAWKTTLEVTFMNRFTGEPVMLTVKGDALGMNAEVLMDEGRTIATFSREFWTKDLLNNAKAYYVTVAGGVDLALMTALCVCYDECKHDEARRSA